MVAVATAASNVWQQNREHSRDVPYRPPRLGFCGRTKTQTLLAPHSRTFNCGEGIKTIRQPSYLLNTATSDFILFQRGEVKAGRPPAVPGGLMMNFKDTHAQDFHSLFLNFFLHLSVTNRYKILYSQHF
jgi:hypothetical protein